MQEKVIQAFIHAKTILIKYTGLNILTSSIFFISDMPIYNQAICSLKTFVHQKALTDPVTIQLLRTTNLAALTGRSVTSNDFTKD